jgi:hypothetical protein
MTYERLDLIRRLARYRERSGRRQVYQMGSRLPLANLSDEISETEFHVQTAVEKSCFDTMLDHKGNNFAKATKYGAAIIGDPYEEISTEERRKKHEAGKQRMRQVALRTNKQREHKRLAKLRRAVSEPVSEPVPRSVGLFSFASRLWLPLGDVRPGAFGSLIHVPAEIQKRMNPAMDTYIDGFRGQFRSIGLLQSEVVPVPLHDDVYPKLIVAAQLYSKIMGQALTIEDPQTLYATARASIGSLSGFFRAFVILPIAEAAMKGTE